MWRKGWLSICYVVAIVLALLCVPAIAQAPDPEPGSGPEIPAGMVDEWTELAAGATRWHAFYYNHPHAMRPGETTDAPTVQVRMETVPAGSGEFDILTEYEVGLWADEIKYTPVGESSMSCGCSASDKVRKLDWSGLPYSHQLTYILVKNPTEKPMYYRLLMDASPYVSFPAPIVSMSDAAEAEAVAGPAVAVVPAKAPAAEEVAAEPVANQWFYMKPGSDVWLSFAYDASTGVKHDADPAQADLNLFVEDKHPLDSVFFDVYTDAEYKQFLANGGDITGEDASKGTPIGCGTYSSEGRGALSWEGHFEDTQTIHVRIRVGECHADGLNVKLEATGKSIQPLASS